MFGSGPANGCAPAMSFPWTGKAGTDGDQLDISHCANVGFLAAWWLQEVVQVSSTNFQPQQESLQFLQTQLASLLLRSASPRSHRATQGKRKGLECSLHISRKLKLPLTHYMLRSYEIATSI